MDYPKLRHIDIFPFESSGQKAVGLRDPAGMNDRIVVVSYPAFFIISLFDGKRSLLDIKTAYMRKYGEIIFTERLEEIIKYLDDNYLLESERYKEYRTQMAAEWKRRTFDKSTGAPKDEWVCPSHNNHAFDCAKMQVALATIARILPDTNEQPEQPTHEIENQAGKESDAQAAS